MLPPTDSVESMLDKVCAKWYEPCPVVEDEGQVLPGTALPDHHRRSPSDVMLTNTELANSSLCKKPFFLMDWLNEVNPKDLARAQHLLRNSDSPTSKKSSNTNVSKDTSLIHSNSNADLYQRSVALGNGYNAKGIEEARRGSWHGALLCWEDALKVRSSILGESHVDVANTHNNIGIAKGKLGFYSDAIESLHQALDIRRNHYGLVHSEVAATMHNIGNVYQQDGDLEAALRCFCECKLQQEQILGSSDHAEVARACIAIGHCYYEADALSDAREAYMDALSMFRRVGLPEDDSEVNTTIEDILELDQRLLTPNEHSFT